MSGRQAFVFLGFTSKRNEMGVFSGVTGKALRLAPPKTVTNRRDTFIINGLGGATFWVETVFSRTRSPNAIWRTTQTQNENGENCLPTHSPHHAFPFRQGLDNDMARLPLKQSAIPARSVRFSAQPPCRGGPEKIRANGSGPPNRALWCSVIVGSFGVLVGALVN